MIWRCFKGSFKDALHIWDVFMLLWGCVRDAIKLSILEHFRCNDVLRIFRICFKDVLRMLRVEVRINEFEHNGRTVFVQWVGGLTRSGRDHNRSAPPCTSG